MQEDKANAYTLWISQQLSLHTSKVFFFSIADFCHFVFHTFHTSNVAVMQNVERKCTWKHVEIYSSQVLHFRLLTASSWNPIRNPFSVNPSLIKGEVCQFNSTHFSSNSVNIPLAFQPKGVDQPKPHNTIPANQQQRAYSSQSQDRGKGGGCCLALVTNVHESGGGASEGALLGGLVAEFKYQHLDIPSPESVMQLLVARNRDFRK